MVKTELDEIHENYARYAEGYAKYKFVVDELEQERELRAKNESEFQNHIVQILKEFQPFQEYFEAAEQKNKFLEEDEFEFLTSLRMAMLKISGETVKNGEENHWTLQRENENSLGIVQQKINGLCDIIQ